MSVESALFVDNLETRDAVGDDYDRLYFGNEFCDKRLPGPEAVLEAFESAENDGMDFSYVTPILTPTKVSAVETILDRLASVGADVELVFNDWGVFQMAKEYEEFDDLVAGRVLSRQKRDPTVTHLEGDGSVELREDERAVSKNVFEHFQKSVVNASYAREHFANRNVNRVELDVLAQGIFEEDISFSASLYFPWNFLTVKRWCQESTSAPLCNEACEEMEYTLDNRPVMPRQLYRKNNVVFLYNEEVPNVSYVDREVFVPEPIN